MTRQILGEEAEEERSSVSPFHSQCRAAILYAGHRPGMVVSCEIYLIAIWFSGTRSMWDGRTRGSAGENREYGYRNRMGSGAVLLNLLFATQ